MNPSDPTRRSTPQAMNAQGSDPIASRIPVGGVAKTAIDPQAAAPEVILEGGAGSDPSADRLEPAEPPYSAAGDSWAKPGLPFFFSGRDELNLAEFPITLLVDRAPEGQKTIEFQDKIFDEGEGKLIHRKVTVTASDRYGLPTPKDDDVILGLIQLTKEAGDFSDRNVRFNRADLVRLLGWPDSGQSYQRIDQSLRRWLGVTLIYENAWWDRKRSAWTTRGFHLIDGFELVDSRSADGKPETMSRFTWNEVVFQSFQAGYMKRLEWGIYLKLKLPTAKRIYRFLDKRFFHRNVWEFDLREFAFEHVGMSRSYSDNGKLKEKLKPAIDELTSLGFLAPLDPKDRYTKVSRAKWKIRFIRGKAMEGGAGSVEPPGSAAKPPRAGARKRSSASAHGSAGQPFSQPTPPARSPESAPPPISEPRLPDHLVESDSPLVASLAERGVSAAIAREIVARHAVESVQAQVDAFDWLTARQDKRVSRNPAGYLVKAIRETYAIPKGFETPEQRRARLQQEEDKRRQARQSQAERDEVLRTSEDLRQARIDKFWTTLSAEDRVRIEAEAIAEANPVFRKRMLAQQQGKALVGIDYHKIILDSYLEKLLHSRS